MRSRSSWRSPTRPAPCELIAADALWNAGLFCFRADVGLAEIERLAPDALKTVRRAIEEGVDDLGALRLGESFASAPKISFDHAIMEHTTSAAVVETSFDWSDIGDWKAVWEQSARDEHGIAREGMVHARDVTDSYLRSDGRLLCVLGVHGSRGDRYRRRGAGRADRARPGGQGRWSSDLESQGRSEARTPARVHRPWGWYQTMDLGDRFRVKRIFVPPGKKLSLQRHHHRAEHWIVVRGTAEVTRDDEVFLVRENESVYLPFGCVHRLANPGRIPVEIVEVQTGGYLEEDDIVRIEDDFGRS